MSSLKPQAPIIRTDNLKPVRSAVLDRSVRCLGIEIAASFVRPRALRNRKGGAHMVESFPQINQRLGFGVGKGRAACDRLVVETHPIFLEFVKSLFLYA